MLLLAFQIPDRDVSVGATRSHAAVARAEGNCAYSPGVCVDQGTILEVGNPAGNSSAAGNIHNSRGF